MSEVSPEQCPKGKKRVCLWIAGITALVFAVAALLIWHDTRTFLDSSPDTPGQSVILDVEPGMTLAQVAASLKQEGFVTDAFLFQILARFKEKGRSIQAGLF